MYIKKRSMINQWSNSISKGINYLRWLNLLGRVLHSALYSIIKIEECWYICMCTSAYQQVMVNHVKTAIISCIISRYAMGLLIWNSCFFIDLIRWDCMTNFPWFRNFNFLKLIICFHFWHVKSGASVTWNAVSR